MCGGENLELFFRIAPKSIWAPAIYRRCVQQEETHYTGL